MKPKIMTAKELALFLIRLPDADKLMVICSSDAEGNRHTPLDFQIGQGHWDGHDLDFGNAPDNAIILYPTHR